MNNGLSRLQYIMIDFMHNFQIFITKKILLINSLAFNLLPLGLWI